MKVFRLRATMIAKTLGALVGIALTLFPGSSQASVLAYATTGDGQFGVVDLSTGIFNESGNMGLRLTGLGVAGDIIYGGGYNSGTLYSINPLNGSLTTIGSGSLTYWATGSTNTGLFALDNSANMNLYSINRSTGAATLIGATGLSPSATVEGMSTGSNLLYVTRDSSLYVVNTITGAATLVGTSNAGLFGPTVVENGTIYSGAANPSAIYTLSAIDGSGTFVTNVAGADTNFWGLAPDPVPLPAALPLFATGLGALGLLGWRRKRKAV